MHKLIETKKAEFSSIVDHFKREMQTIRTGRASPALVEHVLVEAYGVKTPLVQLASLAVPDPKTLLVQPWDKTILKDIERGIALSNLGVTPVVDGATIRLTLQPLTEETRAQVTKIVKEKLEASRNVLRRLRDTFRETIITDEREKKISEDERYRAQRDLDEHTKATQEQLTAIAEQKEKEIMTV